MDARREKAAQPQPKAQHGGDEVREAVARARTKLAAALATQAGAQLPSAAAATVDRASGSNRYETAAILGLLADEGYQQWTGESFPLVFVATGTNYPDALSAGAMQVPILLTDPSRLPAETLAAIDIIQPIYIMILGGPGAVSYDVESALLANNVGMVERLSGANRFDTSAQIDRLFGTCCGAGVPTHLATGENFPDALAAGPAARYEQASILLGRRASLPLETAAERAWIAPDQVIVSGGSGAISEAVLLQAGNFAAAGNSRGRSAGVHLRQHLDGPSGHRNGLPGDALAAALRRSGGTVRVVADRIDELAPLSMIAVGGTGAIAEGAWEKAC